MTLNSRLIFVEGVSGSGKSTAAQFICHQLQKTGLASRWYYEEDLSHPVALEYDAEAHPTPEEFLSAKLSRWNSFVRHTVTSSEVHTIEGHLFQANVGLSTVVEDLEAFQIRDLIRKIVGVCTNLTPVLVYLRCSDHAQVLRRKLDHRGTAYERHILATFAEDQSAQARGWEGYEGLVRKQEEEAQALDDLFAALEVDKLCIDTTEGDRNRPYQQICDFLSVPMSTYQTPSLTDLSRLTGIYTCDVGGEATAFEIRLEDAELVINDMPWMWAKQRLLPQEGNVFYVAGKPYEIEFDGDLHGEVKSFHVSTQLDWGMPKQVFPRIRSL